MEQTALLHRGPSMLRTYIWREPGSYRSGFRRTCVNLRERGRRDSLLARRGTRLLRSRRASLRPHAHGMIVRLAGSEKLSHCVLEIPKKLNSTEGRNHGESRLKKHNGMHGLEGKTNGAKRCTSKLLKHMTRRPLTSQSCLATT